MTLEGRIRKVRYHNNKFYDLLSFLILTKIFCEIEVFPYI